MQEPEQNRSEQATPYKRSEARKRGQVAKSLDFNSAIITCGFAGLIAATAGTEFNRLADAGIRLFGQAESMGGDADILSAAAMFTRALMEILTPVLVAAVLLAIAANLVQAGPILSAEPLKPQLSRLNPITGFKRVYSRRALVDAIKTVLKLSCYLFVSYVFFSSIWAHFPDLLDQDPASSAAWFGVAASRLAFRLLLVMLLIGLLDILWTRWQFSHQLMMSRREIKEEVKRREGDPLVRQRIRELQRENLKQASSLARVRDADVLITNPEHLAIALAYDRTQMAAPQVVAKGADLWAAEMRRTARAHGVPILERRSLARRLYKNGIIGRSIPVDSYVDVARVYADLPRPAATLVGARPTTSPAGAP